MEYKKGLEACYSYEVLVLHLILLPFVSSCHPLQTIPQCTCLYLYVIVPFTQLYVRLA